MTPRNSYLLLAALLLASLAGGIAALRFLPGVHDRAAPRLVASAPPPIAAPSPAEPPNGAFLQGLRGYMAQDASPEPAPQSSALSPQAEPTIEKPAPEIEANVSFPADAPAPPARPSELAVTTPDAVPAPGAAPMIAPLPPARPADLAALGAEQAAAPLPPIRPQELARAAPESAEQAQEPAAAVSAAPASAPASQQIARAPEPTLRPAPEDAFPPQADRAPARFNMGDPVFVRIFKKEGELELWLKRDGRFALYRTYPICKWSGRLGPKLKEADYQSPEGFYSVSARQLNPNSNYHRAFNVGYPNAFDRQNGRTGGLVMVHGNCKSVGCFAMTDKGIEEIYAFVASAIAGGQREVPVHIFPFRLSESTIARETGGGWLAFVGGGGSFAQWAGFWRNLKEGYDLFEQTGEPPTAYACGDHYAFGAAGASCKRVAGW